MKFCRPLNGFLGIAIGLIIVVQARADEIRTDEPSWETLSSCLAEVGHEEAAANPSRVCANVVLDPCLEHAARLRNPDVMHGTCWLAEMQAWNKVEADALTTIVQFSFHLPPEQLEILLPLIEDMSLVSEPPSIDTIVSGYVREGNLVDRRRILESEVTLRQRSVIRTLTLRDQMLGAYCDYHEMTWDPCPE